MTIYDRAKAQTQKSWQLDPVHTSIAFTVKHLLITTVKGHFTSVGGMLIYDEADPSRSQVQARIDAASFYTGLGMRDNDVKSPRFLDVKKYPLITFNSTRVELLSTDRGQVIGNLTVHGVTREVALDTWLTGRGPDSSGQEIISFEARTSINRKDFGLHWNALLETGGILVGDTIEIAITAEATSHL